MRRTTTTLAAASAAALCLGVLLTGCGDAADQGYVAVGAAGPADDHAPTGPVAPRDGVELTPLDGAHGDRAAPGAPGDRTGHGGHGPSRDGNWTAQPGTGPARDDAGGGQTGRPPGSGPSASSPTGSPGNGGTPAPPRPSPGGSAPPHGTPHPPGSPGSPSPEPPSPRLPPGPGAPDGLLVGNPGRDGTDVRWCQRVTLDFLNTGDTPVTAGTVTFGTHIIGALGIDWATISSRHRLPLPLAPGTRTTGSWRVCVDAWRVPLGMHLDTRDIAFTWK
ncbi:hypothetical protein [Streptomyces lydicus]|uniref:hypothetical protein n=1 Tax=Streptomyces lydicus TaxID=47763 RepID=UPI00287027B7|nr:hypothetical protein [Streptomyces lydicus]